MGERNDGVAAVHARVPGRAGRPRRRRGGARLRDRASPRRGRRWTAGGRSRGRLRALEAERGGLAAAADALAAERGFRWAPSRGRTPSRLVAAACRMLAGVRYALERLEIPVVAVAAAEPEIVDCALRPLDGAFAAVVTARGPRRCAACRARPRGHAPADRVVPRRTRSAPSCAPPPRSGMRIASPARASSLAAGGVASPRRHDAGAPARRPRPRRWPARCATGS